MDGFIIFFRNILSGPLYIVAVVIAIILIFACIGYLAEKGLNEKKIASQYVEADSVVIDHPTGSNMVADITAPIDVSSSVPDVSVPIDISNNVKEEVPSVTEVMPVIDPSMNAVDTFPTGFSNVGQLNGVNEIPEVGGMVPPITEVNQMNDISVNVPVATVVEVPTPMPVSEVSPVMSPVALSNTSSIPEVIPSVIPTGTIPTVTVDSTNS